MPIQLVVLGDRKSGKTTLTRRLTHPETPINLSSQSNVDSQPTPSVEYAFSDQWSIWTANKPLKRKGSVYYTTAEITLYCVDLSLPYNAQKIEEEISEFRIHNPDAPIVLVGTKKDQCEEDEKQLIFSIYSDLQSRLQDVDIKGLAGHTSFAAQDNEDLAELTNQLVSLAIQVKQERPRAHLLLKARNKLPPESLLYQAIDRFILITEELDISEEQLTQLGQETNALIDDLQNKDFTAKGLAIETFNKNCHLILNDQPSKVTNAIEGIVAAVLVTLFVFAIGFAVGCALGSWSGPFALLTGISTGTAAAVTLLTVSGGCGALIGGLTAFGIFKEPSVGSRAIDELTTAATNSLAADI
ncbi:Rab family GTPase [Legionella drozanskii]|uniref:Rab family GTPase n=1 Tax=Legionella drozanskii TaxID=96228 RepID=UPI001040F89E|nr:Rab family GTPase [Legionella drozanskii]